MKQRIPDSHRVEITAIMIRRLDQALRDMLSRTLQDRKVDEAMAQHGYYWDYFSREYRRS